MKNRLSTSLILIALASLFMSATKALTAADEPAAKPNVVFILVDDLGYADVGFNGSTFYETPNIDRLSKESLVFEYAYMYPTCSPSRVALATGKDSYRTGVYTVPVLEKGDASENIFSRWTIGEEHTMYSQHIRKSRKPCLRS